jgi:uncharacterized RDD family membrane protein YckC
MEQTTTPSPAPVSTPTSTVVYASFGRRLVASIVDGFVIGAVVTVIMILFAMVFMGMAAGSGALTRSSDVASTAAGGAIVMLSLIEYLVMFCLIIGYQVVCIAKGGQTLGKKALGIKVVKLNGETVTMGTALMRELLGRMVAGFIPFAIGYLWMLWDKDKQGLHDKIAGTIVIKV